MKNKKLCFVITILALAAVGIALLRRYLRTHAEELAWQKRLRPALDVLACPQCHGVLTSISLAGSDSYLCPVCLKEYPVVNGVPLFIAPPEITGWNRRLAGMYDWFSWGYRLFSRVAFTFIGMTEEQGRREITDRLEPHGGPVLEVSIGPGVNLPYLVGRPDVGEIFGMDISTGQLKRCREYVARHGWEVQLQLGNAEQLPYQDNTFAGVFHIGGINFFNDRQRAIQEMIRVAQPGTRILICDEKEQAVKAYERLIPGFMKNVGKERALVAAPLDLIPPEMENVLVFDVWKGWFYCIEFTKPGGG